MPLNPSLKLLSICYQQKNLLYYVNMFRAILERNVAFQWFSPLIKFCGKEFQNKGREKSITEGHAALWTQSRSQLLTLWGFPFLHLHPPLPPLWHLSLLVTVLVQEKLKWPKPHGNWSHVLSFISTILGKIILMVSPNCWVFNILSNKLFFFFFKVKL